MSEYGHHQHGGQHGSHGAQIGHHGGDGSSLAQSLGLGHHGHHGGFLAHLLGLDHNSHHGHQGHNHHAQGEFQTPSHPLPSQSAGWNSGLQGMKLSDAFQGINVTPNVLFLMLFVGMVLWLFVVYWIRHHDPMANHVLGVNTPHSALAGADRQLIEGMRGAVPYKTTASTGEVFTPNTDAAPAANLPALAPPQNYPPVEVPPQFPGPEPKPTPLSAAPQAPSYQPGSAGAAYGALPPPPAYSSYPQSSYNRSATALMPPAYGQSTAYAQPAPYAPQSTPYGQPAPYAQPSPYGQSIAPPAYPMTAGINWAQQTTSASLDANGNPAYAYMMPEDPGYGRRLNKMIVNR